jgi:ABC-2 type transport system permease protein
MSAVERRTPLRRAVVAQALLEVRLLVRSGESLLLTLVIPLGVLVFLSLVDVVPTGDGPAVDLLVPGVLAISVVATGLVAVAIQTAFERKYGVLKRLGGTPLPRWGFLAAKGLATGIVLLVQTVLVVAVALGALGWEPRGGALVAPLAIVVGAVTSTALGLLLAGTVRAEATLALANAVFLVLLVISGVTFDAAVLPQPLATLGAVLPMGALANVLKAAFAGEGLLVAPLLVLAGWGVAAIAVATQTFRWDP